MKPRERLLQELLPMESATVPLRCIRLHLLLSVISSSSAMPSSSSFEFSVENCRKPTWRVWNFSHFCHFWQVHMSLNCRFHRLRKSRHFLVFPVTQLIVTLALPISGELNQAGPIDNASSLVNMWHDGMIVCHVRRKTFQPECDARQNKNTFYTLHTIRINQSVSINAN